MKCTLRLTNVTLTADVEIDGLVIPPVISPPPAVPPIDPPSLPSLPLPIGFSTDRSVGFFMLVSAMDAAGLTPIGVQGKGALIIVALKAKYPALDVYLSPSDAPVWPGRDMGSLDVTVDSGKKGWSFRPDGVTAWQPIGLR